MSFLEMRIKRWKRLFIHKGSFDKFLETHLMLFVPYTKLKWHEGFKKYVSAGGDEYGVPYQTCLKPKLVRKCNIAERIEKRKVEEFIRKTKNDITHARMQGLISSQRLLEEMEALSLQKDWLTVPVHNQEIKKYIEKTAGYRLQLYKDVEDKARPLYKAKKTEEDEKRIKPTVLYWFNDEEGN